MNDITYKEIKLIEVVIRMLLSGCAEDQEKAIVSITKGTPFEEAINLLKEYKLVKSSIKKCPAHYRLDLQAFSNLKWEVLCRDNGDDIKKDWEQVGDDFKQTITF